MEGALFPESLLSYDTWGFALELALAAAFLMVREERREHFCARVLLAAGVVAACALLGKALFGQGWLNLARYALVFAGVVAAERLCFRLRAQEALFFGLAAYNAQHASWRAVGLAAVAAGGWFEGFWMTLLMVPLTAAISLAFLRALRKNRDAAINNRQLIAIVSVVIAANLVLSYIPMVAQGSAFATSPTESTYAILCCLLTLALQSGMLTRSRLEREQALLQELWELNKGQYEFTKQSIDVINARSHDLKKQLGALVAATRGDGAASEAIQEMRRSIEAYDNKAKTGNPALDVLLTQKLMQAQAQGATLTYLIDGAEFGFLDEVDLYALFGNVLDNALEAVAQVSDPARRVINLRAVRRAGLLVVHCENYLAGTPAAGPDGLPATSKPDAADHGFGLRSMRMVAERYHGNLAVRAEGDVFHVQVVIPAP